MFGRSLDSVDSGYMLGYHWFTFAQSLLVWRACMLNAGFWHLKLGLHSRGLRGKQYFV